MSRVTARSTPSTLARRAVADPAGIAPADILALQQLVGNCAVQRLPLSDEQWIHISRGEVKLDNKKPYLVGYHWTKDPKAVAEKTGGQSKGPNQLGVYEEEVQTKEEYAPQPGKPKQKIKKGKASTFWPDNWSDTNIKDVIANTTTTIQNNMVEVLNKTSVKQAVGMKLFVNPDSIFPVYVPDEEEAAGGRRGGRKGKK